MIMAELPELGASEPQGDRRPGRSGALQQGQRTVQRQAYDVGRQEIGAQCPVYGHASGHTSQSGDQGVLRQAVRGGQGEEVALTAAMRKLLTIINIMVRDQTRWDPTRSHTAAQIA